MPSQNLNDDKILTYGAGPVKHLHSKENLIQTIDQGLDENKKSDVHFILINESERLSFEFIEVNYSYKLFPQVKQGFKLWLNRCQIKVNDQNINTKRVLFWHSLDEKIRIANDHTYIFTNKKNVIEIIKAEGENANIGFFNVWSNDKQKCYEFGEKSWIKTKKMGLFEWIISGHLEYEENVDETIRTRITKII